MHGEMITIDKLELGDIIMVPPSTPYGYATVIRIKDNRVYLVRPYIHTSDFTTTSGLIPYTGLENYSIFKSDVMEVILVDRRRTPAK